MTLMRTYAPAPVTFTRGEGTILFDQDGRRYLDFLSGLAVTSLGHAHPRLANALARQAFGSSTSRTCSATSWPARWRMPSTN